MGTLPYLCLLLVLGGAGRGRGSDDEDYDDSDGDYDDSDYDDGGEYDEYRDWAEDRVWQTMLEAAVEDIVATVTRERALYGQQADPLALASLLGDTLHLERWLLGYSLNMTLAGLQLRGLADISVGEVMVERSPELGEVRAGVMVEAGSLLLSGQYSMEAVPATWLLSNLSSEGWRAMTIQLEHVKLGVEVVVGPGSACDGGAVISAIHFPLEYGDIVFEFDNIGPVIGAALDVVGGVLVETERRKLADLIRSLIGAEVASLVCGAGAGGGPAGDTLPHYDTTFQQLLLAEQGRGLRRDRLAENLARKIYSESISRHLQQRGSQLRRVLDPFQLFPLELPVSNSVFSGTMETCNFYLHNAREAELESVILVRDAELSYSAWRLQFHLPLLWITGRYFLRNSKLFKIIPVKGSGDFMIDMKDVKVSLTVVLRNNQEMLDIENFNVDAGWRDIGFKFDGFLSGLGEVADTLLNELGVGGLIVRRQKERLVREIKSYLRGTAVCMMWSPGMGLELCMRRFWINLGWEYPWVLPSCQ